MGRTSLGRPLNTKDRMTISEELAQKTQNAMVLVLLDTVVSDPNRMIGEIYDAMEGEEEYLFQAFRELTVNQIVTASIAQGAELRVSARQELEDAEVEKALSPPPGAEAPVEDESVAPRKKKKRRKKKSTGESAGVDEAPAAPPEEAANGHRDLADPDEKKTYHRSIIAYLEVNGPSSSQSIRKDVGGDAGQLREAIDEMIVVGRVSKQGQARGMKYLVPSA